MINEKPQKTINRIDINNFGLYSQNIEGHPFIKKFMFDLIKKWIENLPDPMQVPWIFDLYRGKVRYLDDFLQRMENQVGEDNLDLFLRELFVENFKTEEDLYRKTESIYAELLAFSLLEKEGHKDLRKIRKIGDIESDIGIISVKSILDLDLNYKLIENVIWSLIINSENFILRKIDFVRLYNKENIDYKFLKNIITFLEESLTNSLEFLTKENKSNILTIEFQKSIINKANQTEGLFKVSINRWYQNSTEKNYFYFDENRKGEKKKHKIEMMFERDLIQESDFFYVTNDTTMWGEGEGIDPKFLAERLEFYLHEIDRQIDKVPKDKCFIGWINVSVSPMYQNSVIRNIEKIQDVIKGVKGNRKYQVVLCLAPQLGFEMKEPQLIFC
jgi:hypothetical protein